MNYVKTNALKKERLERGLTYEDMAKKLGYRSKSSYMNIERGLVTPNIITMNKVAEILDKPVQYFFKIKVQ